MPPVNKGPGQRIVYLLAGALATLLLQLTAGIFGPFGMLFNLLAMVPAALVCMLLGPWIGGGIVALATAALAGFSGTEVGAAYLLQFGLGSLLLPMFLRRSWAWDKAVAMTLLLVVVWAAMALGVYLVTQGQTLSGTVGQHVQAEIAQALEASAIPGQSESERARLAATAEQMTSVLVKIYPGLAVTVTGLLLLLTVLILTKLARGRFEIAGPPFSLWKTPEPLVWILIAGGFGGLLADGWVQVVAWNLLAVLLPLYFLQGMAVVSFFFQRKGFSPLMRALGYILLMLINPFQLLVAGIGVFDLWIDFRKPRIKKIDDNR